MTVWIVYSEFNRGYDTEGSAAIEGVCTTAAGAEALAERTREAYRTDDKIPVYGDDVGDDECEWGVDVHVEEHEVVG